MSLWDKNVAKAAPTTGAWPAKANPGNTPTSAPAEPASSGGSLDAAPAPAPSAVTTKHHAPTGAVNRDGYWAAKEDRDLEKDRVYRQVDLPAIRRSTAYSTAATLAAAALSNEAISFGSAAKGKRLDMFLGYVDLIAAHVFNRLENGFEVTPTQEGLEIEEGTQGGTIDE